jgi:hypothetical protein
MLNYNLTYSNFKNIKIRKLVVVDISKTIIVEYYCGKVLEKYKGIILIITN